MTDIQRLQIEETVKNEKGKLFSFIRKRVKGKEDAEDILQDTLLQFVNAYTSIGSVDKVVSWLYTVARNKITDSYRKKKTATMPVINQGDGEAPLYLQDILPDLGNDPEDAYFRDLIWEEVQAALEEMPQDQRDVFVANEFDDVSFKEIAETTGVPVNTLLSRKRYAVLYLRKKLRMLYETL